MESHLIHRVPDLRTLRFHEGRRAQMFRSTTTLTDLIPREASRGPGEVRARCSALPGRAGPEVSRLATTRKSTACCALLLMACCATKPGLDPKQGAAGWQSAFVPAALWPTCVVSSPDGGFFGVAGHLGSLHLWNVHTNEILFPGGPFPSHVGGASSLAVSPDGTTLVSAGGGRVMLWDTSTRELGPILADSSPLDSVHSVAFAPDGSVLATPGPDNSVSLYDASTWQLKKTLSDPGGSAPQSPVHCVAFSPDGATLAAGRNDGTVWLWDVSSGSKRAVLEEHVPLPPKPDVFTFISPGPKVYDLAFSPDGSLLATVGWDSVWVYRTQTAEPTIHLTRLRSSRCLAFSADGRLLAAGGRGWTTDVLEEVGFGYPKRNVVREEIGVALWDATTGELDALLDVPRGVADKSAVSSLAFSPNGDLWAAAGTVLASWERPCTFATQSSVTTALELGR